MNDARVTALARRLGRACRRGNVVIAVAESCTGGGLAEAITRVPGSSRWFDRGVVTYSNAAKRELLGVSAANLDVHGAVSEAVVREMAAGVLARGAAGVSVAITGIAGPGGGSPGKPAGLVWIAWGARGEPVQCREFRFRGGRAAVRKQAVATAIQGLIELIG